MKRREFLEGIFTGTAITVSSALLWGKLNQPSGSAPVASSVAPNTEVLPVIPSQPEQSAITETVVEDAPVVAHREPVEIAEDKKYLTKIQNFDAEHIGDIYLTEQQTVLLKSTLASLDEAQRLIGHGHFNVVGFDHMLKLVKRHSKRGALPKDQLDMIEALFEFNAKEYGFYGDKIVTRLTSTIPSRDILKIPYTGHYLYKGDSQRLYETLRRDVGDSIILTSGIRGMVKQTHLFMAKAIQSKGNLSRASRSLAPPGHSYHAIGDFDVGKVGFGRRNFTKDFAQTDEYKRLQDLGYVDIRYTSNNRFGVRYEPWHVKVV